jgi:hypothetical protein
MKKKEPNFTWNATIEEIAKLRKSLIVEKVESKRVLVRQSEQLSDHYLETFESREP